jgi:hypothetical protein
LRNWFSLITILFLGSISLAWNYEFHPSTKYNGLDLYEISSELKKNSFFEMDLTRSGRIASLHLDQIYLNEKNKDDFAVVIFDLQAAPNEKKINFSGNQLVCHAKTSQGRNFAIYFSNKKLSEGVSYCESGHSSAARAVFNQIIPRAAATDCASVNTEYAKNVTQIRDAMLGSGQWLLQKMGTCLLQAKSGGDQAVQSFADGVGNFGETIKNLTSLTPEKLWEKVSEKALAFKNFVSNISSEVKSLIQNFKNLDPELIMSAVCKSAGESFVSGLIFAGVAGVAAKIAISVAKFALQLKNLTAVFERLNHMKALGRVDLANGILSCAVR